MSQEAAPLDGRVRRGARNRQKILEALFELVGEGVLRPTAEQVADRAGVGTRTVFRHFADMESLLSELSDRVAKEMAPLIRTAVDANLSFPERLVAEVNWRATLFERIAPFKRSSMANRARSETLREAHRDSITVLRTHLLQTLPELETADSETAEAMELALSFEAWNRLRADQRLGKDRARAVLERMAIALSRDL